MIGKNKIDFIVFGISGCGRKESSDRLKNFIIREAKKIRFPDFQIVSDIEIAHEAAFNGREGAVLILETGWILYLKKENGETCIIGGNVRLIGDEGSGYSIAKKGLQAVSKYFDGRNGKTILADLIKSEFFIDNRSELIKKNL